VPDIVHHTAHPGGIPGSVGEKHSVGFQGQHFHRRRGCRHHQYLAISTIKQTELIVFNTKIIGHYPESAWRLLHKGTGRYRCIVFPAIGRCCSHTRHHVAADNSRPFPSPSDQGGAIRIFGGDHGAHRSTGADPSSKHTGIQPFNPQDTILTEKIGQVAGGAVIAGVLLIFADKKGTGMHPSRLHVLGIDPVVTNERIGHGDQLTCIGRIGQHLLITAHAGVEYNFPCCLTGTGKGTGGHDSAVFKSD
jgi:hypothetical protein